MSAPECRANYRYFCALTTRWSDNDVYGHINNVAYYSFFDSAVNKLLIEHGILNIQESPVIGVVVSSQCAYHASLSYPEELEAGVRIEQLGRTSVRYGVGIFKAGSDEAAAHGDFVHVFVDRKHRRPVPIAGEARAILSRLIIDMKSAA